MRILMERLFVFKVRLDEVYRDKQQLAAVQFSDIIREKDNDDLEI